MVAPALIYLGVTAGVWAGRRLLTYLPSGPIVHTRTSATLSGMSTNEGDAIPLLYGRVRIFSPVLAWVAGTEGYAESDGDKTATQYRARMLMLLGIPPEQHQRIKVHALWVGDRKYVFPVPPDTSGDSNVFVDLPDFLGGFGAGGGIRGDFDLMGPNDLSGNIADVGQDFPPDDPVPGFRGFAKVDLDGHQIDNRPDLKFGWRIGESPSTPPYSFEVSCLPVDEAAAPDYYKTVGLDGANPAGVLHDLLTARRKGNLDEALLDLTSFEDAAATLLTERHAFSLVITDDITVADIIEKVLNQIDAVIYEAPLTGLLTLKLIRADYDASLLPLFDESNTAGPPDIEDILWPQVTNDVKVEFPNRVRDYLADSRNATDTSVIGYTDPRCVVVEYPGCCDASTAAFLATRTLRSMGTPLQRYTFTANRDGAGATIHPGAAIRYSCADDGVDELVLRVVDAKAGPLEDGNVVISAVVDIFGVDRAAFDPDLEMLEPVGDLVTPPPVMTTLIEEAPAWLIRKAIDAGNLAIEDQFRLLHIAIPNARDVKYKAVIEIPDYFERPRDIADQFFSAYGRLAEPYLRTAEPYDTTGVDVEGVVGALTLRNATSADVQVYGTNVALIFSAAGAEWIAFGAYTGDVPTFTMDNVYRGLGDTPAIDHPAGAFVVFLQAGGWQGSTRKIGINATQLAQVVTTRIVPSSSGQAALATADADPTDVTITARAVRPYPPADYALDGLKELTGTDQVEVGAVTSTWKRRDRASVYLLPGNLIDSGTITEGGGTIRYSHFGKPARMVDADPMPLRPSAYAPQYTDEITRVVDLGMAGHGELDISIRAKQSADDEYEAHRDPSILVDAPHWRNLLQNGDFSDGTTGWIATAGTISIGNTTATSLGNNGSGYAQRASGSPVTFYQEVFMGGFPGFAGTLPNPAIGTTARASWYEHRNGDADDTVTVVLGAYDAAGGLLGSTTVAAHIPSASGWQQNSTSLVLPTGTYALRLTFTLTAVADGQPSNIIARTRMTLGQNTGSRLTNAGFETAALASWTTGSGAWRQPTATPYELGNYAAGGAAGTCTLYQEDTVPTGFEGGAVALVEFAYCRDDVDDTGTLTLAAYNAAGTLLDFDRLTVDPLASPLLTWATARVVLTLPYTTDHVRVTLTALRATGAGNASICFDDVRLTYHKELQVRWEADMDFSFPVIQPMPPTIARWWQDITNNDGVGGGVSCPTAGLWGGDRAASLLPNAPRMEDGGVTYVTDAVFPYDDTHGLTGEYDGTTTVTSAIEFTGTADLYTLSQDPAFGHADRIAVLAWIKVDPTRWAAAATGILGRLHADRGWSLELTATGKVRAKLVGTLATVTLDSTQTVTYGVPHMVGLHHQQSTNLLYLIVDGVVTSTSTAAVGIVKSDPLPRTAFRIGRANESQTVFPGQIARVYIWKGVPGVMPEAADLAALYTHATDPSGLLDVTDPGINAADVVMCQVRGGVVATTNGDVRLMRFRAGQVPIPNIAGITSGNTEGDAHGLASGLAITNAAPDAMTSWTAGGDCVITSGIADAEGFDHAVQLTAATGYAIGAIAPTATATMRLSMWVKMEVPGAIKVELRNNSGTLIGAAVTTSTLYTLWQRLDVALTWDNSTPAAATIRIYPAVLGVSKTIYVSTVVVHQNGDFYPTIWPAPLLGDRTMTADVKWSLSEAITADPASRLGIEGEIHVTGHMAKAPALAATIATLYGTGNDGIRTIRVDASGDLFYDAGNAAGTVVTSEVAPIDAYWVADLGFGVRAQWNRAGLTHSGAFAGLWFLDMPSDAYRYADNDVAAAITHELTNPVNRFEIGPFVGLLDRVVLRTREQEWWVPVAA